MAAEAKVTDSQEHMLKQRWVLLSGPIDDACASRTIAMLLFLQMQEPQAPVTLLIDSRGGQVTATLAILDTMAFLSCPVHTRGLLQINGSALWILAAGVAGHRCCQSNAWHSIEPTRFLSGHPDTQAQAERLNDTLAERLSSRTNLSRSDVMQALQTGRSFNAAEALLAGIIDRIVQPHS